MQIRILAGCQRLLMAAAIASLISLPAGAATTAKAKSGSPGLKTPSTVEQSTGETTSIKRPVLYPRSNYVWPFATGPVYGEVDASRWRDAGVLHMAVGSFDLTRGMPNFPTELTTTNKLAKIGTQYFLLQVQPEAFTSGLFDQMKSSITAQGGAFVGEMPIGAFIVRMTPSAYQTAEGFGSIIALTPFHPAYKLSPEIGRAPLQDPVKAASTVYSLALRLFPGESSQAVASVLAGMGVTVNRTSADTVYVDADRSKLAGLAGLEAVSFIYEDLPLFLMAEETTTTMQTGRWNSGATPYTDAGVDGGGLDKISLGDDQIMMIIDSGIQVDAGDLSNTRTDGASTTPIGATHRKVLFYGTTNGFGGAGDLLGCDSGPSGGSTHGHTVSATALGNATRVPVAYGAGWQALDINSNPWDLDGVAPKARLVAYDASVTPATGSCDDPGKGGVSPGTLYTSPAGGGLGDGYARGARIVNFSWGSPGNTYDGNAQQTDLFLFEKGDAMVFIAAGNNSTDTDTNGIPDPGTIGAPASFKNGIAVGSSHNANDQFNLNQTNNRSGFSSVGPATPTSGRIQPLLMAPGSDPGGMGLGSEFNCRSNDNDQNNPVECDIVQSLAGTSFASPAAAGAALLVRDYFAQGFYPDGTNSNPANGTDVVSNISGDLVKAVLVASADWMNAAGSNNPGTSLTKKYRFNREQGYGRIQLSNALPLQTYAASVSGLIVDDGGLSGGTGLVHSTTLNMNLAPGTDSGTFSLNVCDNTQPLTIAIAWMDPSQASDALSRDLNLEVVAPAAGGSRRYLGNFFTDDADDSGAINGTEECTFTGNPWPPDSAAGIVDAGPWSLPVNSCGTAATHVDAKNPVEAVFLSPDSRLNGIADDPLTGVDESADNQIVPGLWSVKVSAPGTNAGNVNYAIAISGGVCLGSTVRIQRVLPNNQLGGGTFVCNDSAKVTVNEIDDIAGGDPGSGLTPSEISSRTKVEVVDFDGTTVVDTETGLTFTNVGGLRFDSNAIPLTDGTAPDPGNGTLDVRSGQTIRVTYQDEKPSGTPDTNGKRVSTGTVDCRASITAGGVVFGQFGKDAFTLVSGGCEQDARGYFTFGFPDRYMDAGELVGYLVAFQSAESIPLQDVKVSLKAVEPDGDSPLDCKPGSTTCPDPNRANNPPSPYLTVLDSPKVLGTLPAGSVITPSFTIQVASSITGVQKADMVLGVSAKTAGKGVESFAVQRETLNADETSFFYSTDFPTGGSETVGGWDINNNEILETVTNSTNNFLLDYWFETRSYSDLTAGGFNTTAALQAPWNFDTNNGGFKTGLHNSSFIGTGQTATLAFWGEDRNFNDRLDGFCTLQTTLACTADGGISQGCDRCANDLNRPCFTAADCIGTTTCNDRGTCNFNLGEDRDTANNSTLDQAWNTLGGCGWQTKATAATTGGVWHTGLIKNTTSSTVCIASGTAPSRCQSYEKFTLLAVPTGSSWWQLLLTPVVNKVNQCVAANGTNCPRADLPGDPVYQVAITDWAWNMLIDLPDQNTGILAEFDTDIDKLVGAELYNDFEITNIPIFGNQGAVSGGNGPITGGFNIFAPVSHCIDTDYNGTVDHCGSATGTVCTSDSACTGNTRNGTAGNSREGLNNCYFEGKDLLSGNAKAQQPWGLATPPDDDVANSYCLRSDALSGIDKSVVCTVGSNTACTNAGAPYTTCFANDAGIDEFVQKNGPGRNYGVQVPNGPDMRFTTLEDFYGDTGTRFQAALGFYTAEPTPSTFSNAAGYGVAVDDMVISWKETRLDEDTHTCSGSGECADIELKSTLSYDGNSLVEITVTDRTPWDDVNPKNDCDGNGSFADAGDDQDCNNNGINDVTVKLTSLAEPTGEIAVLDRVGTSDVYLSRFPYSSTYNSPGTIYVQRSGTTNPVITARYEDRDTISGNAAVNRCKNALDPTQQGFISAAATVSVTAGRIALKGYTLTLVGTPGTNGDNDGYADAGETLDMAVSFTNKSGLDLDDLTATLGTLDPNIECISKPLVSIGSLLNKTTVTAPAFRFKVKSTANRVSVDDTFRAIFNVTLRSKQFDVITRNMEISVDLDLNATGGGGTSAFIESFEASKGFGFFTLQTLDANKADLVKSDGMRCQYNNPDFINTNSPGNPDCFLGFTGDATTGLNDWHIHVNDASNGNQGRAYNGSQSLHWGVHVGTTAKRDTTRLKQLDAVKSWPVINLPTAGAGPELFFAHQVSLVDGRLIRNITAGEATDRAVVQIRLVNSGGSEIGNWLKIFAYENEYDQQGTDDFFNCTFDPTDDGNNEDTFFSPSDPARRLGPSSTCNPEFVFARGGCTDYRATGGTCPPDNSNIGLAFDGPGLSGSIAAGTWVKPRFSLAPWAGRRINFRFVATTIELGGTGTWDAAVQRDDLTSDDGWYIDDVHVDQALSAPVTLSVDGATVTPLPCGACGSIVAALTATPTPPLSGPGRIVTLSAKSSTIDLCPNGVPQYQFWIDGNTNGVVGDAGDTLMRDWTDNSTFVDAPQVTTSYGVVVRCSSSTTCDNADGSNDATVAVAVNCPSTGNAKALFTQSIGVSKATLTGAEPDVTTTVSWTSSATVDAVRGDLILLRGNGGNYTPTVAACAGNNVTGTSLASDAVDPGVGGALYYLVRPATAQFCNQTISYSSGNAKEIGGRDAEINASGSSCP